MNGYGKILLVALLMIIISIINEKTNPYINAMPTKVEYIHIYLIRYIHYICYLFSSFYLLFFNGLGTNFDKYVYLILIFSIVLGWYMFDSCILSFFELLFYNIDMEKVKTTFHPVFYSIYGNYSSYIIGISGILYIINVSVLLYYLKSVKLVYKAIYYILFLFLFFDGMIKGRLKTMYYSIKNKNLAFCKKMYDEYVNIIIRLRDLKTDAMFKKDSSLPDSV